jgi:4,5-dihydroxyphthalate decarboxylase
VSLRLTTAFWNYDRTQALVDGRVKVEGCELDIELLRPEITFAKAFTEAPSLAKSRSAIR